MILTHETGKPLAEAKGEFDYSLGFTWWFAGEAERVRGTVAHPAQDGRRVFTIKQPIGVAAALVPWNFPVALVVWLLPEHMSHKIQDDPSKVRCSIRCWLHDGCQTFAGDSAHDFSSRIFGRQGWISTWRAECADDRLGEYSFAQRSALSTRACEEGFLHGIRMKFSIAHFRTTANT